MLPAVAPAACRSSGAWHSRDSRSSALLSVRPFAALLLPGSVGGSHPCPAPAQPLWPLLTPRSAERPRCPFGHKARSPQVRVGGLPRATVGSTPWPLGREELRGQTSARPKPARLISAALRLLGGVLPVRRLAVSLPASFSAGLTAGPVSRLVALRFVWVAATSFPEDSHLLSTPMLGTR